MRRLGRRRHAILLPRHLTAHAELLQRLPLPTLTLLLLLLLLLSIVVVVAVRRALG